MHRYRRPGIKRPIDDLFASHTELRRTLRTSASSRKERLDRLVSRLVTRHKYEQPAELPLEPPVDQNEQANVMPADRRHALRQPAVERPFQLSSEGRESHDIWMEDISRSGMRFRSEEAYSCGTLISVTAPETYGLEPVVVRIVRARMISSLLPERGYEYGTEFVVDDERPHAWYLATRARR
jgi:hypothetical protein